MKRGKLNLIFLILILSLSIYFVSAANDTLTVEINVLANEGSSSISIEVPDSLYMGEINEGGVTDKFQVYINHTGNVNITITPELESPYHSIFNNLYFQDSKTGNNSQEFQIGDYSFSIAKPSTSGKRSEYFWMWLDLAQHTEDIADDKIGVKADIRFIALPSV